MEAHFKALAGDVLKSQSEQSAKQQQERLGYLLTPLRERLEGFQKQVKEATKPRAKSSNVPRRFAASPNSMRNCTPRPMPSPKLSPGIPRHGVTGAR